MPSTKITYPGKKNNNFEVRFTMENGNIHYKMISEAIIFRHTKHLYKVEKTLINKFTNIQ